MNLNDLNDNSHYNYEKIHGSIVSIQLFAKIFN